MKFVLDVEATLPADGTAGTLVGRVWRPDVQGPSVVAVRADGVYDISRSFPTMRDLGETGDPATSVAAAQGERIGTVASILVNTPEIERGQATPWLLAPVDLQAIKAAGVTFAVSLIERVIEEQARGQPERAAAVRSEVEAAIGGAIEGLVPGSPQAMELKRLLGTSKNCHQSSGAPNLPANDSALFSFRFYAVHAKDVRDCQLRQLFEVPYCKQRACGRN